MHEMTLSGCRKATSDAASTMESLVEDENESDDSTKGPAVENDTSGEKGRGCSCR